VKVAIIAYNTASQLRPLVGPRIVHMAISQTSIGDPHDLLEFPKLFQETGQPVVDLLSIGRNYYAGQKRLNLWRVSILTVWMRCGLDHP
jgi:hypothetical protein